ncbi:MAG TPA: hypothetical protein VJN18_26640 [Polyangiaceae bacterium]|nr:hypothetical protein [Polyangiaceae bacterium]
MQHHEAKVQTALLPPPSEAPIRHTGRLWVELGDATWETQCRFPQGQRQVCFAGVRKAAFGALARSLWTTFPEVTLRDGEPVPIGDYLLKLDITLDAMPPDADGPGWSAVAAGGFRLSRDGKILHEERLGSRSRAAFAYGGALGVGAGEVVDAFAAHVAQVLGAVAEERPLRATPLPAVVAEVLTPPEGSIPDDAAAPATVPATPDADATATPTAPAAPAPITAPVETAPALPPVEAAPAPTAPAVSPPTTPVAAR